VTPSPAALLPAVIAAAREAGDMIASEFARPTGPRLIDHVTAPIDVEVELFLRELLMTLLPARFVGEEAGVVTAAANELCWVVDPHDGTRAFLEGKRGSAVSIALLRAGTPVLGVVYAPLSPDRGPDMIAWAEGSSLTRNGEPVTIDLRHRALATGDVVFLNHGAWQRPVWNSQACAPAGFMPLPSIAYRLARIAVGDGIATQTLRPVNALDIAAGHALLLAAGGVLLAEDGQTVTYNDLGESRPSACFGGAPAAVATLLGRAWRGSTEPRREPRLDLTWPRAAETPTLDRATGCLLGLACGDALGARVAGWKSTKIRDHFPQGVTTMGFGPSGDGLTGQVTQNTEHALALARALVSGAAIPPFASHPPTSAAPIGIWARSVAEARPSSLAAAIHVAVAGGDRDSIRAAALADGHVASTGLAIALEHLARGTPIAQALPEIIALGGDTAGNAAITGALLGAEQGRTKLPAAWVMAVLTCRPDAGLAVARSRPDRYWTDDLVELAEALLIRRLGLGGSEHA
jgi:fructose-1,6-bisphosphatase/inositol monophosphatase family enzyme